MSRKTFELCEGAILIGDAHYASGRPQLLDFLRAIDAGMIRTPQIVFMGDIFDLLFGFIPLTRKRNKEAIALINRLSLHKEVIYLEGNHDFQLASIFPHAQLFSLWEQPVQCHYGHKNILLAHGDFGLSLRYRFYTRLIRSSSVLQGLRWIDSLSGNSIIKWLDSYLAKKEDCNRFEGFKAYIKRHLEAVNLNKIDYFIEGHYHQNVRFKITQSYYINLAAFACNQRYFIVQSMQEQELLEEVIFAKEPV